MFGPTAKKSKLKIQKLSLLKELKMCMNQISHQFVIARMETCYSQAHKMALLLAGTLKLAKRNSSFTKMIQLAKRQLKACKPFQLIA